MKAMGMTFGKDFNNESYFNFFDKSKAYYITKFQRPYTWGEYQIEGVLNDLEYIKLKDKNVGWPSILLQKTVSPNDNPNIISYDLGDGQQRVISITLALIALWQNAYLQKSIGEISSEEFNAFRQLIPEIGYHSDNSGILAKSYLTDHRTLRLQPTISFYSNSANNIFTDLFYPLQDSFWSTIDSKIDANSDGSGMLKAFKIYYEYFKDYSIEELIETSNNILTKITLSVLEYEHDEDMMRAFSNMNSFGVPLTEDELVKAVFYKFFRTHKPDLAETIAEFWTNELESKFWKNEDASIKTSPQKTIDKSKKKTYLVSFLEEFSYLYEKWDTSIKRAGKAYSKTSKNHWLRDSWILYLEDIKDYDKFWSDFVASTKLFKTMKSTQAFNPGTLDWEINYTSGLVNPARTLPSILMKLNIAMSQTDFIKSLRLLQKYWVYLALVTDDAQNLNQSIIKTGSPMLNSKITYEELLGQIESLRSSKRIWRNKSYITNFISNASYSNSKNKEITNILIYLANEELRDRGATNLLFNPKTFVEGVINSREHILPQTPREAMTDEDRAKYDYHVQRIGNALVLSGSQNSVASNKSVSNKLDLYKDSTLSPWGNFWINNFLEHLDDQTSWTYKNIDKRSLNVAEIIASRIATANPFSDFKFILELFGQSALITINEEESICSYRISNDGVLIDSSDRTIDSFEELRKNIRLNKSKVTAVVNYGEEIATVVIQKKNKEVSYKIENNSIF